MDTPSCETPLKGVLLDLLFATAGGGMIAAAGLYKSALLASIGLACCAVPAVRLIRNRHRSGRPKPSAEPPMRSLVLWERTPRLLDDRILAQIISSVWPGDYSRQEKDAPSFVVGLSSVFLIKSPLGMFMLNNHAQPYFNDNQVAMRSTVDMRTRRAIEDQAAWLSVDLLGEPFSTTTDKTTIYREIGRLVADLSSDNTIGLFCPESRRFYDWHTGLAEALRAGEGLQALEEHPLAPVIPVDSDDDDMLKAIATARARWPEFCAAFARRHPEHLFSVKAPLSCGDETEHIWITVDRINRDTVEGRLGNDPLNLGDYKMFDLVTVPVSVIEDWMYLLSDKPVGGFTVDIVTRASRKSRPA